MKNFKKTYLSLTLFAVFMFSFSYMLVPLYDIFCEITGLNGKPNPTKVLNIIEKGGEEQLKDELTAYNPLITNGKELTATLMFEIDNPVSRSAFLSKVGGIEEKVFIKIDGEHIKASPEKDVDRTSAEVKASSVQCIHFKFNDEQIQKFKLEDAEVEIGINHKEYSHTTKLSLANLSSLSADFS